MSPIKFDGKEADYETTGLYTKILDASPDARTMEMEMKNGQKAKFTLKPNKNQIKLVFINNKTSNYNIYIKKDFSIQVANYSFRSGASIKVKIVAQTIGIRAAYEVGNFNAASEPIRYIGITSPG